MYEPVDLPQDLRQFDFMSPWEGADYVLPGDEKAATPPVSEPKTTEKPSDTGAGAKTDKEAAEKVSAGSPSENDTEVDDPAPEPTEDRKDKPKRKGKASATKSATEPKAKAKAKTRAKAAPKRKPKEKGE